MNFSSQNSGQLYQFDILRGIAIICVFLVHSLYAIYPNFDFEYGKYILNFPKRNEFFKYLSMSPFAFGWLGVVLFFIISGFLIHLITLNKGVENFEPKLFYNKRFWRIYPPYLIFLFFFTFTNSKISDVLSHPFDFLSHLFLLQTFSSAHFFSINGVFWSLAIEVHLYILYPVFLFARRKLGINKTIFYLLIIHILSTALWWFLTNCNNIVLGNFVLRHWFTWALGAYLAECYYYKRFYFSKLPGVFLMFGFLIFYLSKLFYIHKLTDYFFSTLLLAVCTEKYLLRPSIKVTTLEKLLIQIGLCSYSFYLLHMPFLYNIYGAINIFNLKESNKLLFWLINTLPVFIILLFISYSCYLFLEKKSVFFGNIFYDKIILRKK